MGGGLRAGRCAVIAAAVGIAFALVPDAVLAQIRGPEPATAARTGAWTPAVGARAGWATRDASPSLGLFLRAPIPLPLLGPALVVAGDAVFQGKGLVERQGTLDLTVEVLEALYTGGGPVVLNTIFGGEGARETKVGHTIVVGARGRIGLLTSHFEIRWVRVDVRKPRFFMFGLSYPILGRP